MVNKPEIKKVNILGLNVDKVTMAEAVDFSIDVIERGDFAQIITLNAEIAYLSYRDSQKKALVNGADLATPDGSGILWASEKYGDPVVERVSGVDLTENLMKAAAERGHSLYCLGAKEEVVAKAVENIQNKFNIEIAGWHNGYFSLEESDKIAADIKASNADILLVAMGYPRQDQWIAEHGRDCGVKIAIGIGGSFDVFAGLVKRAPKAWQSMRLEWLYRLIKDPRRFKRTLNLPKFMFAVKADIKTKKK